MRKFEKQKTLENCTILTVFYWDRLENVCEYISYAQ